MNFNWPIYFEVVTIHLDDRSTDHHKLMPINFFTVPSGHVFFCMSDSVLKIIL